MVELKLTDKAADDLWEVCNQALKNNGLGALNMVNEVIPQLQEYRDTKKNGKEAKTTKV